uniref:Galactose-3-O-sulfotransferase 3 n=1 Tax=Equus asinus TaxID=9793 RepID=A0A9L0IHH4_EQUAS
MPPILQRLQQATKMMSRRKILLLVLGCSTLSLLIHQGAQLSWYPKLFPLSCPPLRDSPPRPKHMTVAFLKTHKTAGTTVQNILFRFAERHNLTVALPHPSCEHQFCYPRNFSAHFVHPATRPPHVLASHLRFNRAELARLMPPGTVYVTILREPAAMFESLFSYYNQYCPAFRRVPNASLEAFLRAPEAYYRAGEHFAMFAHNTLAYDLGGDNERSPRDDAAYLAGLIRQVEEVFSLVMIAEYFDESLVLLRRLLAWDLDDVLYAKLNARAASSRLAAIPAALGRAARAWKRARRRPLRPLQRHLLAPRGPRRPRLRGARGARAARGPRAPAAALLRRPAGAAARHADPHQAAAAVAAQPQGGHHGLRPAQRRRRPGHRGLPQAGHA